MQTHMFKGQPSMQDSRQIPCWLEPSSCDSWHLREEYVQWLQLTTGGDQTMKWSCELLKTKSRKKWKLQSYLGLAL